MIKPFKYLSSGLFPFMC